MKLQIKKIHVKSDPRGSFFEILRREDTGNHTFGQISISTAKPGEVKGGHYHIRKREWYFILQGKAKIEFIDRKTGEKKVISVNQKDHKVIEMPRNVAHTVTNTGKEELKILIYISESYDKKSADTFTI